MTAEAEGSYGGTAKQFVSAFQANAQLVHNSPYDTPNIFVAQDSAGSKYESDSTVQNCSWIVAASNANGPDVYLADHYENSTVNGKDVSNSVNATEWRDWLKCASAQNRPLGFGEYGLDNSPIWYSNYGGTPGLYLVRVSHRPLRCDTRVEVHRGAERWRLTAGDQRDENDWDQAGYAPYDRTHAEL